MKRILLFTLAAVLVLSFSVLVLAQPAAARKVAKEREEYLTLNKSEIMALQTALAQAGVFRGKVDGRLGPVTRRALRDYQRANNLKVTGRPYEATLIKLRVSYRVMKRR